MKRISTKTTKRVAAVILAAFAACSMMGCSVEKNFTTTKTHTVTDANGNTTTTTTTNNNGTITTETYTTSADEVKTPIDVEEIDTDVPKVFNKTPIAIVNNMDFDIASLNIKLSTEEDWSDDLVEDDVCIEPGIIARGITMTFDEENRFIDIHVVATNGEDMDFNGLELPTEFDEEIVLSFEYNEEDGSYTVYAIS